jgi:NitT/TauT family transport system ATP-binding protein
VVAAVEIAGVDKRFEGHAGPVHALAQVDLAVAEGEFVSLLGPSGCGKSTLLRLLAGLSRPDGGSLRVLGAEPGIARRAKQVALVPQTPALLPWRTVRANARLLTRVNRRAAGGRPLADDDIEALLAEVGLADVAGAYPHQLSGGMQQRVALVRAFALGAPLLLMDEPFAALDEILRSEMHHLLLRLWQEHLATVVFVTHSVAEAVLLADRVVVMAPRPGRVAAIEPIDLPRPRSPATQDDPAFTRHVSRLRHLLAGSAP